MAVKRSPHKRFAQWLQWKGWSQVEAAKHLECHHTMISLLCRGQREPGLHTAHLIERLSAAWPKGAIRTEHWDQTERRTTKRVA